MTDGREVIEKVKKNLDLKEKRDLWNKIYRRLHEYFPFISVDIILKDEQSFETEKEVANTISNEAYLDGSEKRYKRGLIELKSIIG